MFSPRKKGRETEHVEFSLMSHTTRFMQSENGFHRFMINLFLIIGAGRGAIAASVLDIITGWYSKTVERTT